MPGDALMTVARDQKRWSLTANALKTSIERARMQAFGLAIAAAVLETGGAQMQGTYPESAVVLGYLGAASLAVMAVIRQWKLGHEQTQAWILARSGSEALKREMFLFRTSTGPYASGNPDVTLIDRRDEILAKVQPVQKYAAKFEDELKALGPLDLRSYLDQRVTGKEGQINYYNRQQIVMQRRRSDLKRPSFGSRCWGPC